MSKAMRYIVGVFRQKDQGDPALRQWFCLVRFQEEHDISAHYTAS